MALAKSHVLQILLIAYVPFAVISHWGLPNFILLFYLARPWQLMLGTYALPTLALAYAKPGSLIRALVLPLVVVGVNCYHFASHYFMPNRTNASGLDGPHMLLFLTAVDALLIRGLYLDKDGKERALARDGGTSTGDKKAGADGGVTGPGIRGWGALGWALNVIFSYRAIGTGREAKNLPTFPGRHVPSRTRFLLNKGLAIMAAFLFVDFLNHQTPPSPQLFAAHKSLLLLSKTDSTTETILVRIISTVMFWLVLRVTIGLIYNVVSFAGVAAFLTDPVDWPPYFGNLTDTYTLRKYWAVFWHSGLRNPLLGSANFFTYDVLRLRRGTLIARYINIWLAFGMSGAIHALCDHTMGVPVRENTAYKLFLMQALGITLEDFVQWIYRFFESKQQPARGARFGAWQKVLGHLWVASWLVLTTPAWSYQNMRHDGGQLFSFSVVEALQVKSA